MNKVTNAVLSLMALAMLTFGASSAQAKAGCCDGRPCCNGSACCHSNQK